MFRKAYHTQEKRATRLQEPILCVADNAWLGDAFYFWIEEQDAVFWGINKKKRTKKYDIYVCDIDCEDVLDTVFNEEHYRFWLKNIEKVAKKLYMATSIKPTLKDINDYFKEKNVWTRLDGIMFQDISKNDDHYIVKEFQYKKRIQIAVYNDDKIANFAHHFTGECV